MLEEGSSRSTLNIPEIPEHKLLFQFHTLWQSCIKLAAAGSLTSQASATLVVEIILLESAQKKARAKAKAKARKARTAKAKKGRTAKAKKKGRARKRLVCLAACLFARSCKAPRAKIQRRPRMGLAFCVATWHGISRA